MEKLLSLTLLAFCATCLPDEDLARSRSPVLPPAAPPVIARLAESDDGEGSTFDEIAADGLPNACYVDTDHYVAEFLHQNPDACLWTVDESAGRVVAQAVPEPPADAVPLPPPSGKDDTAAIEAVLEANPGGTFVGRGVYRVDTLDVTVPVTIHDMPMKPWRDAGMVVRVHAPDVTVYDSPIDAENSARTHTGFRVEEAAERFTLVRSGFSNVRHTNGRNVIGVHLRGGRDFHLACNTFGDISNRAGNKGSTARANAIVINGGNKGALSGGVIANNDAREFQSSGKRKDAEFLTIQNLSSTDPERPLKVFANRALDAGKRFTKHQEGDALVLSNRHEWSSKKGPLGQRKLLAHVEVQSADNVIARNNRVSIGADSRFDYVFHTAVTRGSGRQDNIHYDCNDIEIRDELSSRSNNSPHLFVARAPGKGRSSTGIEATNSSVNNNRVHGGGSVKYHFWFGEGYADDGGIFQAVGNDVDVPATRRPYKPR